MARDFGWVDLLWAVIKADGTYAGAPCFSWEEARELSNQHKGSKIFIMEYDNTQDDDDEPYDIDNDCGFDPYMGCFSDDC